MKISTITGKYQLIADILMKARGFIWSLLSSFRIVQAEIIILLFIAAGGGGVTTG